MIGIPLERVAQRLVDAELAPGGVAIAQAAVRQAVEAHRTVLLLVRLVLESRLKTQVLVEPGCAHGARGQSGGAGELHDVFGLCIGQHALECNVRVALGGHGEGCAQLHR